MSDAKIRQLERAAAAGDTEAADLLSRERLRGQEPNHPWLQAMLCDVSLGGGCTWIPDQSVSVVVTSPPYKRQDGYNDYLMNALGAVLARVLEPGARVFMNFGQLRDSYWRPFEAAQALRAGAGGALEPGQTIIWNKSYSPGRGEPVRGHVTPLNGTKSLNYGFEYVFTLFKPPEPSWDRLSVGVPFADEGNLRRGQRGKNGNLRCRGDVWTIPYRTRGAVSKKAHVYEYPEELVEDCLRVAGVRPGQAVFEPFLGSGTTVCVAKRMGLNAFACEINEDTLKCALERWNETE